MDKQFDWPRFYTDVGPFILILISPKEEGQGCSQGQGFGVKQSLARRWMVNGQGGVV